MIDSKDLRLGNLILGPSDREETIVAIIGEGWVKSYPGKLTEARFDAELKYCSGISLTEEWLIKLGFLKADFGTHYYKDDFMYISIEDDSFIYHHPYHPVYITTVHQLQNLYYSLVGQELQLTQ
jgi:hypothetical protein